MNRNHTIDTLRTIATLLVILLHVSTEYVNAGRYNSNYNFSFWTGNVVYAFSSICVPIFVLISGMYLVGREEKFEHFYRKRASRLLIPLMVWSIVYLLYRALFSYVTHNTFDLSGLTKSLISGTPFYHMWYVYMLIGLYFVTPLINNSISKISRRSLWVAAILLLVLGLVNVAYNRVYENKPIFILWFVNYLGYYLLGFLIKGYRGKLQAKTLLVIYVLSGLSIAVLTYFTIKHFDSLYFYSYLSPLVILGSLSIFTLFQQLRLEPNLLSRISYLTFGIYLIHAGVLEVFKIGLGVFNIHVFDSPIIGIPVKFAVTFFISTIIAYLFHKSNVLKRII